ncbi:MAG: helix-hairpin-helix domain-containing protein [Gammaproteobacteria bacterium]|nr:helix-hairpin-helix domain-containing protein [Gammaproteobacteria bacterium]MBQ0838602.1 helix-hairpin-helix domain-containing protein [Gammaproteobacteria bacterium]
MMLACVCAVVLLSFGTGPVFAEVDKPVEKAVVSTVNINKADAKELASVLINIGESKAQAIVKYREEHGSFTSKAQLKEIKGIGSTTLKKNEALITL